MFFISVGVSLRLWNLSVREARVFHFSLFSMGGLRAWGVSKSLRRHANMGTSLIGLRRFVDQ